MDSIYQLIPSFFAKKTNTIKANFRLITSNRSEWTIKEIELKESNVNYQKETFRLNDMKYYCIEW